VSSRAWAAFAAMSLIWGLPVAGLLLILAGSWLSTDGRMPPGLRRPSVATA
jgi:hypothetical protein